MNVFDIIGPIMIGPSSSHTALWDFQAYRELADHKRGIET